jgi:CheY-like chemotaxis protein
MLAHELRNPLTPLRFGLAVLQKAKTPEQTERAMQAMDRQISHLTKLVDDLLDVARIKTGKIRLTPSRLDLCQLIRTVVEDFKPTVQSYGVTLSVKLPEDAIWLHGDATRLAQAIQNLLSNACKFNDKDGHIDMSVVANRSNVELSVMDTGVGLDEQTMKHLFEPFAQADSTLDRSRGGLGLGLALVKGIVELHKGSIVVLSEGSGRGTCFKMQLPLSARSPDVPTAKISAVENSNRGGLKVLIIEDNADSTETLKLLLELTGYETYSAANGDDGIALARHTLPDIIISDIGLPGNVNGYEVAKIIRADPLLQRTRLIALSGYGTEIDQERARQSGFQVHLTKPVDPDLLQKAMSVTESADQLAGQKTL